MERCPDYVGLACVDGTCPIANREEYGEYGISTPENCNECFYNKGCEDCALADTEHCDRRAEHGAEE